jgi:hypothetical protein
VHSPFALLLRTRTSPVVDAYWLEQGYASPSTFVIKIGIGRCAVSGLSRMDFKTISLADLFQRALGTQKAEGGIAQGKVGHYGRFSTLVCGPLFFP